MNKELNKVLKIDEKNETITIQAQSEVMAERLAYRTHVFNTAHETELTDIVLEKNGNYSVHYTMYIDYDNDFMGDDW
jgi:hypothetical protein